MPHFTPLLRLHSFQILIHRLTSKSILTEQVEKLCETELWWKKVSTKLVDGAKPLRSKYWPFKKAIPGFMLNLISLLFSLLMTYAYVWGQEISIKVPLCQLFTLSNFEFLCQLCQLLTVKHNFLIPLLTRFDFCWMFCSIEKSTKWSTMNLFNLQFCRILMRLCHCQISKF